MPQPPVLDLLGRPVPSVMPPRVTISLTSTTSSDRRVIDLYPGQPLKVGRASSSNVKKIQSASDNAWFACPVISRLHAVIEVEPLQPTGFQVKITDMKSRHGTSVGAVPLAANKPFTLRDGDIIKFGSRVSTTNCERTSTETVTTSAPADELSTATHDAIFCRYELVKQSLEDNPLEYSTAPRGAFTVPSSHGSDSESDVDYEDDAGMIPPSPDMSSPEQPDVTEPIKSPSSAPRTRIFIDLDLSDDDHDDVVTRSVVPESIDLVDAPVQPTAQKAGEVGKALDSQEPQTAVNDDEVRAITMGAVLDILEGPAPPAFVSAPMNDPMPNATPQAPAPAVLKDQPTLPDEANDDEDINDVESDNDVPMSVVHSDDGVYISKRPLSQPSRHRTYTYPEYYDLWSEEGDPFEPADSFEPYVEDEVEDAQADASDDRGKVNDVLPTSTMEPVVTISNTDSSSKAKLSTSGANDAWCRTAPSAIESSQSHRYDPVRNSQSYGYDYPYFRNRMFAASNSSMRDSMPVGSAFWGPASYSQPSLHVPDPITSSQNPPVTCVYSSTPSFASHNSNTSTGDLAAHLKLAKSFDYPGLGNSSVSQVPAASSFPVLRETGVSSDLSNTSSYSEGRPDQCYTPLDRAGLVASTVPGPEKSFEASKTTNRISIPDIMTAEEEVPTKSTDDVPSGTKRKASEMETDEAAPIEQPKSKVSKASIEPRMSKAAQEAWEAWDDGIQIRQVRRPIPRPMLRKPKPKKESSIVKRAVVGVAKLTGAAALGAAGTIVFLSSPYAEQLIQWIG